MMEDDKSVKAKQPSSIPANYVTIVELQERWIKERQRIDKEKQDHERRMQEEKNRAEKQKERDSNYFAIVDLQERQRKEKRENERRMQEKKKRAEKQPRLRNERDSNYVTIVDLQERWIKERERKEKEKQDKEHRVNDEKEGLKNQKEIDSKKVEPAPGFRNRRRGRYERWNGKPKPRAEGEVTVENGSCRVERKSDDGDLGQEGPPEIEEKFENLSLKGVNRENSARANGPRIEGSRNLASECVPKAKVLSLNEERCHGRKPRRNGGNWNVDINGNADKVLVCDRSGSNPIINPGNRMQRSAKIDGKLEKVPVGSASGRSNPNITKSSEMDRNMNVDEKLVKALTSGAREGSTSSNMMVPTVGSNTSNGGNMVNKNFHTEGKCVKDPVTARVRCYSRVEMNGFKRGVCLDRVEMVWVKKGEVFAGNDGRIHNSRRYSMGSK